MGIGDKIMTLRMTTLATAIALSAFSMPAMAAPTIYFGETQTPSPAATVSGAAATARASFLAQLGGVSTEDFEGLAAGTPPATLTFAGSAGPITAAFTGVTGQICTSNGCGGPGRFATSGTNYLDISTNAFSVTFSTPVAAFGFYGTDIGDFNGQLTLTLTSASGTTTLTVPNTLNGNDGSLLFYGIIDTANPFTSITFGNTAPGADLFGFDDITVGDVRQVTGGVPEPTTWAMMIIGFGAIGGTMRRRSTKVAFAA